MRQPGYTCGKKVTHPYHIIRENKSNNYYSTGCIWKQKTPQHTNENERYNDRYDVKYHPFLLLPPLLLLLLYNDHTTIIVLLLLLTVGLRY